MDYSGFVFGDVKVLRRSNGDLERCRKSMKEKGRTTDPIYTCKCLLCGSVFDRNISAIKGNKYQNCGCKTIRYDLSNKRFGKLIAIRPIGLNNHKEMVWECVCDCGSVYKTTSYSLRTGKAKQCKDCAMKQIGDSNRKYYLFDGEDNKNQNKFPNYPKKLLRIHSNIKSRCYNKSVKSYKDYGGRGIEMCEEWKNSFLSFAEWALSNGYKDGLEIDRIDNNGNYTPQNCRFTTHQEQANNRRTNYILDYNEQTDTMANWSRKLNIPYYYIQYRVYKGKKMEDIVNEYHNDTRRKRKKVTS